MKAELGYAALVFGVTCSLLGVVTLAVGIRRHDPWLLRLGRNFVFAVFACAVVGVVAMEWALLTHDFSLTYVAENNARSTPFLFTVAGLWAALEGSILLWALILGGYLVFVVRRFRDHATDPLVAWATLVGLCVALFFFLLMLFPANPFHTQIAPTDGRGPNALLQNHWLMAIHPPMLYLGYVGFTVPFAFAIAALVTGRFGEGWLADIRRSTLVAWGFLTIGIILGAWWSYEVLGWGGYWAWDPVENASLLPWLTGTAFIHSVIVQERRGMLRVWNLSLVIATFCLTILGTFLTRSGVLNSVHSFTESPIGPWLLGFLAVVAAVGIGLIAWRGDQLRSPGKIDSPISRESAFLGNNLLFAALAFVVLLGTVYPLLAEALQGRRLSVGEPYFNRMTTPLGLALLFLMAVAPALPWRAVSGDVLQRRLLVPAWIGAGTMIVAVALGAHGITDTITFGLAAFAFAGIVRQFVVGARARRGATDEGWPAATVSAIRANPRLYGGLVVHTGIILIAIALVASNTYATKREVRLTRGESAVVAGYRVTYLGSHFSRTGQNSTVTARVRVERGDADLGVYEPAIKSFPGTTTAIGTPSVKTGFVRDVYLTLISSPSERGRVTIGVAINPMVVWLWIGGGVVALGTLIALLPSLRRRRPGAPTEVEPGLVPDVPPPDPRPPDPRPMEGARRVKHPLRWIAIGVAVLVTGFAVVLASQVGSDPRADAKISQLLGDPVPSFSVEQLDGTTLSDRDLAGRAVIVNFWNSWCIPCEQELPALREFYARHAGEADFMMLGIVRSDTEGAARRAVKRDGMDWDIALDPGADAALAFGTRGQPETFAISPDGTLVASLLQPARVKDLEKMLAVAQRAGR